MLLKVLYIINKRFPSALLACPNNICLSGLQHFEAFLPSKNEEQTTPPFSLPPTLEVLERGVSLHEQFLWQCDSAKKGTEIVQNSGLIKNGL